MWGSSNSTSENKKQFAPNSPTFTSLVKDVTFFVVDVHPKNQSSGERRKTTAKPKVQYVQTKYTNLIDINQTFSVLTIGIDGKKITRNCHQIMCEHRFCVQKCVQGSVSVARHRLTPTSEEKQKKVIIDIHHLPIERNGPMPHRQQVASRPSYGVIWSTNIKYNTHLQFLLAKLKFMVSKRVRSASHQFPCDVNIFGCCSDMLARLFGDDNSILTRNGVEWSHGRLPIDHDSICFGYKRLTRDDIGSTSFPFIFSSFGFHPRPSSFSAHHKQ